MISHDWEGLEAWRKQLFKNPYSQGRGNVGEGMQRRQGKGGSEDLKS